MESPASAQRAIRVVSSAIAIALKAGAIREGQESLEFAGISGLAGAGAESACLLGARWASTATCDQLVPTASTVAAISAELDGLLPGLGSRWHDSLSGVCARGHSPMAGWLRSLPGALAEARGDSRAPAVALDEASSGREAVEEESPAVLSSATVHEPCDDGPLLLGELELDLQLTFDEAIPSVAEKPAPDGGFGDADDLLDEPKHRDCDDLLDGARGDPTSA